MQVFSNKYIKIKQPMEDTDTIRIAIDLRHAQQFQEIWSEQSSKQGSPAPHQPSLTSDQFAQQDSRFALRDRFGDAFRRGNLLLNSHNEVMFFNSPCKFHFAFNNSEFHEGVDLNLMNLAESPTHLCVSLPENKGVEV